MPIICTVCLKNIKHLFRDIKMYQDQDLFLNLLAKQFDSNNVFGLNKHKPKECRYKDK